MIDVTNKYNELPRANLKRKANELLEGNENIIDISRKMLKKSPEDEMSDNSSHNIDLSNLNKKLAKYSKANDLTLTEKQSTTGFYSGSGSFRVRSNKTIDDYSTGYHESAVTTDTFEFLQELSKKPQKSYISSSKKGFFKKYNNKEIFDSNVKIVTNIADGFRTDSAQTILSAPKMKAAGHSGANVKTAFQAEAHNLLRTSVMDILQKDPNKPENKGITKKSVSCFFGAMTTSSVAPAIIANTVEEGAHSIKAGKQKKEEWEKNRNIAKERVNSFFDSLQNDEKYFVLNQTNEFMRSITDGDMRRYLDSNKPTSPLRSEENTADPDGVYGGVYELSKNSDPLLLPPEDPDDLGFYFTQPFRAQRRNDLLLN